MLVSEIKEVINEYPEEDLRLLIVELYKAMPQKKMRPRGETRERIRQMHSRKSAFKKEMGMVL